MATWYGIAGVVLLLFALFRFTVRESVDAWVLLTGVAGIAGIVGWAVGRRSVLMKRAAGRGARFGRQTLVSSILLLAVIALINFIAARHNRSFDLTESGLFSLSTQTKQVLHSLNQEVKLLAFFPAGKRAQAADLIRRYADESHHLHYDIIDPDQEPDEAQRNGVTAYGTVVLTTEGQAGVKTKPVRVEAEQTGRSLALSEEKLTNGIVKLVRSSAKTVYFLEGHGEGDIELTEPGGYLRVRQVLENQAYAVKPLFLARNPLVPADCTVLVIAGPAKEPGPEEIKALDKYLESGGKLFVMIDPGAASMQKFLGSWGFEVKPDRVVDISGESRAELPLVKDYNRQHPVTHDFRIMTVFPLARSVVPKMQPGDASIQELALTGTESFAEPYTAGSHIRARFDPKTDRRGPIPLVAAATRETMTGKQARIVVAGSSNFVSNAFFDKVSTLR